MANNEIPYKIYLEEQEMPTHYYNLRADMTTKPAPLLNPGTHQPMTAAELEGVFCSELVQQELDNTTREDSGKLFRFFHISSLLGFWIIMLFP